MNSELDNFVKSPKLTNKTTNGTSYFGINVNTTMRKLIEVLGKANGESCAKVDYCWDCELSTGEVFTIYDWKSFRKIRMDDVVDFHVGGFNKEDTIKAQRIILKELEKYNG